MAPVFVSVVVAGGTASVDANWTATDSDAAPVPDAGVTVSHGTLETAVHVTAFCVPACVRRTDWAGVCDDRLVPLCTAPKFPVRE